MEITQEVYQKTGLGQRAICYLCRHQLEYGEAVIVFRGLFPQKFRMHLECAEEMSDKIREVL